MKEKKEKENRLKSLKSKLLRKKIMGQVKYKTYLRRRFQPVGKQQEFLSKIVTVCCCHSVTIMKRIVTL